MLLICYGSMAMTLISAGNLGAIASRWSEFLAGKVGTGVKSM